MIYLFFLCSYQKYIRQFENSKFMCDDKETQGKVKYLKSCSKEKAIDFNLGSEKGNVYLETASGSEFVNITSTGYAVIEPISKKNQNTYPFILQLIEKGKVIIRYQDKCLERDERNDRYSIAYCKDIGKQYFAFVDTPHGSMENVVESPHSPLEDKTTRSMHGLEDALKEPESKEHNLGDNDIKKRVNDPSEDLPVEHKDPPMQKDKPINFNAYPWDLSKHPVLQKEEDPLPLKNKDRFTDSNPSAGKLPAENYENNYPKQTNDLEKSKLRRFFEKVGSYF